ncbi:unnamed protein product [Anisakis simplex]|uniref:Golgi-associated plant pathogenesis-related protein 1 (inferred by orthology to a human protein) n=1 Tax=Anisakis simplex TaxID=6269 RepID=A0A0M3JUY9_ANISI|nr:unnamed protein product [Anisakis simplex]
MQDKGLDVIVQKYKALGYSEISDHTNQRYQFRFCACKGDSNSPERDDNCVCSKAVNAQLVQRSIPHMLYSSSCIHLQYAKNCLIGSLESSPEQSNLYVRIKVGRATLTNPAYQKIRRSKRKVTAQLTCSKQSSSDTCVPCETGFIEYGENLFFYAAKMFTDEERMAELVTQSFYTEALGYDYERFKRLDYHKTGHFTQMIWKSTRNIGIGVAIRSFEAHYNSDCLPKFDSYLFYVVIKYDPPGNIQSKDYYLDNVLPPQ